MGKFLLNIVLFIFALPIVFILGFCAFNFLFLLPLFICVSLTKSIIIGFLVWFAISGFGLIWVICDYDGKMMDNVMNFAGIQVFVILVVFYFMTSGVSLW